MRVITHLGLGEVEDWPSEETQVTVLLDKPFLGENPILLSKTEVFLLSDTVVVRVLNVTGIGWLSNMQFHDSPMEAREFLIHPTPPDETTFFLDLKSGEFEVNRELGFVVGKVLWLQPWLDRWAPERSRYDFGDVYPAIKAFENDKKKLAGATGIHGSMLLDIENSRLVWLYLAVAPPQGVIFEKKFFAEGLA